MIFVQINICLFNSIHFFNCLVTFSAQQTCYITKCKFLLNCVYEHRCVLMCMWVQHQHEGWPQTAKTLVHEQQQKKACCFNMEGMQVKTHKAFVSFSHSTTWRKTFLKEIFKETKSSGSQPQRPLAAPGLMAAAVYLAMWLKPRYDRWRQLTFLTFIKPSSHWYCLRHAETEGAKSTHYKSSNNLLGLCLLYLSYPDKINKLRFAICLQKQSSTHGHPLLEIVLLFQLKHGVHK